MPVTVLLVDDEPLVRAGLRAVLEAQPDIEVVGEAADGAAVIPLVRQLRPDVVAMDVRMPLLDGIEATRAVLRTVAEPPKILVVTTFENDEYVYEAPPVLNAWGHPQRAGADGFLLKRARPAEIVHAVRLVAEGESLLFPASVRQLAAEYGDGGGNPAARAAEEGAAQRQGRPARRFRFRAEAGHLLGLDIGAHRVTALLADLDGRVLGTLSPRTSPRRRRPTNSWSGCAGLWRSCRGAWASPAARCARSASAAPGSSRLTGTVRLCTALPEWTGLPLGERLSRSFKCPVLVENDANAAAVAEHWKGAATESDNVVFVLAGLSPGAGSLIGGRLHRGYGGAAGEIGALHLLGRGATPEALLSTTGEPLHPLDEQAVAEVFTHAREGDERARAAVDRFLDRLVHDVAALVLALDPEVVVIGGWATGLDGGLDPLRRELARCCLRPPRVALSRLGEAAVATGALRLALDHVEEELFAAESAGTDASGT